MGWHDSSQVLNAQPTASDVNLELQAHFAPSCTRSADQSASLPKASEDLWQMGACPDASQDLSDYDALGPFLNEPVLDLGASRAPSADLSRPAECLDSFAEFLPPVSFTPALNFQGKEPFLGGTKVEMQSGAPSLGTESCQQLANGGVQKARERNKRAQRTFRQRQKV